MSVRAHHLEKLARGVHDVLVVGGGINGAAAAAALAARGARVALADRGDFAGFTSQESSNLVWGGIKYLETREFALVRKLCRSRNRLLRHYPTRVREIRFFTTIDRGFRYPPWFLWLGTWVYWLFGDAFTRAPRLLGKPAIRRDEPAVRTGRAAGGFEYSDAYLPDGDARFVLQFVRAAVDRGCVAANYVESTGARRDGDTWITQARDVESGRSFAIRSKVLVNAAGPFADAHNALTGVRTAHRHLFSKGIHLIVPRITASGRILAFFADDGRLFFAIPLGPHTCIGTTDTRVEDPVTEVTDADRDFVLHNINARLALTRPLTRADVIAERCGVRPLAVGRDDEGAGRDWMALSRRHAVDVDRERAHLCIYGGKLTDCLNVGEEVCRIVAGLGLALPYPAYRWYGEPPPAEREEFLHRARLMDLDRRTPPDAAEPLSERLWRRHGREAFRLLDEIRGDPREAEAIIEGTGVLRCEARLARDREMVVRLEDFLRRRTGIAQTLRRADLARAPGLPEACRILFGPDAEARYAQYFGDPPPARAP